MGEIKDAALTLVPDERFGRNQIIGLGALFTPWITATAMLVLGKIDFGAWQGFHTGYIWPGLMVVLGLGAASSIAKTIKGQ